MSRKRKIGRSFDGVLILDKPIGISSNAALQSVKRLFNANKAGHTGSLDPMATGMLPICFGEATKFSQFLLDANKAYEVRCQLGIVTDTSDTEGSVIRERPVSSISHSQIEQTLQQFRGDILQVPSMFSALKHNGQPLYKLARQGITIEREARPITIFELKCLQQGADYLELFVRCSKGTYIRTLVEDLGEALGCGAHVTTLRRVGVGGLLPEQMVTMEVLQTYADQENWVALDALLYAEDSMVKELPKVTLSDNSISSITLGQSVAVSDDFIVGGLVRIYGPNDEFYGVGVINEQGKLSPKRLKALSNATTP